MIELYSIILIPNKYDSKIASCIDVLMLHQVFYLPNKSKICRDQKLENKIKNSTPLCLKERDLFITVIITLCQYGVS